MAEVQGYAQAGFICAVQKNMILFHDSFSRIESGTWGTPDIGTGYTILYQGNTVRSVDGSKGIITVPAGDWGDGTDFKFGPENLYNFDLYFEAKISAEGDNNPYFTTSYVVRDINYWDTGVDIYPYLTFIEMDAVSGIQNNSYFYPDPPYNGKIWNAHRIRGDGNTVYFKFWPLTDIEPVDWTGTYTATNPNDLQSGHILWSVALNHEDNTTNPIVAEFDNIFIQAEGPIIYNQGQGNAQVKLNSFDYPQHGQAQALLNTRWTWAQARDWTKVEGGGDPPRNQKYAQAYALLNTRWKWAQALAKIKPIYPPTSGYPLVVYQDGAVSYWPIDYKSNVGVDVFDSWDYTIGSQINFDAYSSETTGIIPPDFKAIWFYYYYNYLWTSNVSVFNNTSWTWEGWAKFTTTSRWPVFGLSETSGQSLSVGRSGATQGAGDLISVYHYYSGSWHVYSSSTISNNTWYYLTLTYNSGTYKLYVNKNFVTQWSSPAVTWTNSYWAYDPQYGNPSTGSAALDSFAVYNSELSATAIENHYFAGVLYYQRNAQAGFQLGWPDVQVYAQSETSIIPPPQGWGQSNAWIIGSPQVYAQALWYGGPDGSGVWHGWNGFGQALAQIVLKPVAEWKLDEYSGTTLYDTFNTNNFTIAGALTLGQSSYSNYDSSVQFPGTSGNYTYKTSPTGLPTGSTARSVEIWFKTSSTSAQTLLSYGTTSTRQSFGVKINGSNSIGFWTWSDDQYYSGTCTDNKWHQVIVTYNGSTTVSVYLDNQFLGSKTLGGTLNTVISANGIQLGKDYNGDSNRFNGYIGYASIYNYALTTTQISSRYNYLKLAVSNANVLINFFPITWGLSLALIKSTTVYRGNTQTHIKVWGGGDLARNQGYGQSMAWSGFVIRPAQAQAYIKSLYSNFVISRASSYWMMDESSGNIIDIIGGKTGTATGSTITYSQASLIANGNYSISLTGGYFTAGDNYDFTGTSPFSIEVWLNPTTIDGNWRGTIGKMENSGNRQGYILWVYNGSGGTIGFERWLNHVYSGVYYYGVTVGNTYHVIVTYDGSTINMMVNGTLVTPASDTRSITNRTTTLQIGRDAVYTVGFRGRMDEVAIYSVALSYEDMMAHYYMGMGYTTGTTARFAQSKVSIIWGMQRYGQAQAHMVATKVYAQAQTQVGGFQYGQAQSKIFGVGVQKYSQSLAYLPYSTNILWGIPAYDTVPAGTLQNLGGATDNNLSTSAYYDAGAGGKRDVDWNFDLPRPYWIKRITVKYESPSGGIHENADAASRTTLIINGVSYPATDNVEPSDWALWGWGSSSVTSTFELGDAVRTGRIQLYYTDPNEGAHYHPWTGLYEITVADALPGEPPSVQANVQVYIVAVPWQRAYGQAQTQIRVIKSVFGLALAQIGHQSYAQAKTHVLRTYRYSGLARTQVGGFQYGLAKTQIRNTYYGYAQALFWYGPPIRPAHAQAKIKGIGVTKVAQSLALVVKASFGYALADIKQTYPLWALTNYATTILGATASAHPEENIIVGPASNVMDEYPGTVWTSMVIIPQTVEGQQYAQSRVRITDAYVDPLPEDEDSLFVTYLQIDLGTARAINAYYIYPVTTYYNPTVKISYSTNGTNWTDILTGIYLGYEVTEPIKGFFSSTKTARYWRMTVQNGGDNNGISIGTFALGYATIVNPTFAQAQTQIGHFQYGNALAWIWRHEGLAQAKAQIIRTYERYAQADSWIIPPSESAFAEAWILQTYSEVGQVNSYVIPPTSIGFANVHIFAPNIRAYGSAKSIILTTPEKFAVVQAIILKSAGYGQAYLRVLGTQRVRGQSLAFIGHLSYANVQALIIKKAGEGQSLTLIKAVDQKYFQARVVVVRPEKWAYAQAQIIRTYQVYAQAYAVLNQGWGLGQSKVAILRTYERTANVNARILSIRQEYSQALSVIRLVKVKTYAQANVFLVRTNRGIGQAATQIGSWKFAQATVRILAFDVPKVGLSQGYIVADIRILPIVPSSNYATYLVMFNGQTLPGYAQSESYDSAMNIAGHYAAYLDSSLSEYIGLENKAIDLTMLVWEPTYFQAKVRVQEAASILRSVRRRFAKLYIQYRDKYYLAMPQKVTMAKQVGESPRIIQYQITFEAKPWLIEDQINTISGTGTIDTGVRPLTKGGWTPTNIIVSGTDVTISGITETGQDTGSVSIEGTVSNFLIDTENFTSDDNAIITPKNYGIYVGPGRTTFTITGATSCIISWQNRYYL